MAQFHIRGSLPLSGSITISGRKNAALKLIAAALLTDQDVVLERIPAISDVRMMLEILTGMGSQVEELGADSYRINTAGVTNPLIPTELGQRLRASLVLVGPLLARFGQVTFPHPGGCVIGKRTIAPHLNAFEQLGARIEFDGTIYQITYEGLRGTAVYLKERSVTGTENLIMAACRASGTTTISNAAEEPHIGNLCDLLRQFGYSIQGDGTSTIVIQGRGELATQPGQIAAIADDIEVGTFAVAAAITGGTVSLEQVGSRTQLQPILAGLEDFQVQFNYSEAEQRLQIKPSPHLTAHSFKTGPWPAFPTDLQSPFAVLATQAEGTSLIHDWMYEGRLYFVDLLQKMGANITICDPHRILVSGPTPLVASSLPSPDLRAGASMVLAALAAEGTSTIEHIELIERGYLNLDQRLQTLGAEISREE